MSLISYFFGKFFCRESPELPGLFSLMIGSQRATATWSPLALMVPVGDKTRFYRSMIAAGRAAERLLARALLDYLSGKLPRFIEWMRIVGDTVFILAGALPIAIALVLSYLGFLRHSQPVQPEQRRLAH